MALIREEPLEKGNAVMEFEECDISYPKMYLHSRLCRSSLVSVTAILIINFLFTKHNFISENEKQ